MIDAANKTGSMEFACGGNADDFFPVRVSFYSKKSYSEIQVRLCSVMSLRVATTLILSGVLLGCT